MPISILMPALSPTMTEGTLARWLKKEGESIESGEVIAEIETDKATMEVEAVDEGILAKILVAEGSNNVAVNSLIAVIKEEDDEDSQVAEYIKTQQANTSSPAENKKEAEKTAHAENVHCNIDSQKHKNEQRIFASPLAKRIATQENIALENVTGTGPYGRVIKADIEEAIQNGVANKNTNANFAGRNPQEYTKFPISTMRKVIAERLTESKQNIPHFYLSLDCNLDKLLAARAEMNNQASDGEYKLSVNDFMIKASAMALQKVPAANASWADDSILQYNNIDISVAVAIDGGLITPIVKNADQKNMAAISNEMKELVKKAKSNSLRPEEFQGGGFSISNLGMFGIKQFNAIVNPPQGCILAIGAGEKKAVAINDQLQIATMMTATVSCDHRVIDGAVAAEFLQKFKQFIENPILMMI